MAGLEWFLKWSPPEAAYCKADWRLHLGPDYGEVEPFLETVRGRVTGTYPWGNGNVRYEVRLHGAGWLGVPMDGGEEGAEGEWPRLAVEDVQLWRLSLEGKAALTRQGAGALAGGGRQSIQNQDRFAMLMPCGTEGKADIVYTVGGKFQINGDFSQVMTLGRKNDVWDVPSFTRMVLRVLLTDGREGGLTSEIVYERAKALHLENYPELARVAEVKGSTVFAEKSLGQYFRRRDKSGRKTCHPLFGMVTKRGRKCPTYQIEGRLVKQARCVD